MRANRSRRYRKETVEFGNGFAMLQPICDYPQRQHLSLGDGVTTRFPVRHNTRKVRYFRDPSAVCFAINFNLHGATSFEKPTQRFDLSQATIQATEISRT
jgi:hypothetical protein